MSAASLFAGLAAAGLTLALADLAAGIARRWAAGAARATAERSPGRSGSPAPARRRGARRGARLALATRPAALFLDRHGVRVPRGLGDRLAAAGITRASAARELMALKCTAAAAAALAALPQAAGGAGAMLLIAGPVAAFLAPDALVARRTTRRARLLREQAPEFLDRLRLACEAGLDPDRALTLAAAHGEGLLVEEIRAALAATHLGLARNEAMTRLCARCPVPEVKALVAALDRAALHGSPLGPAVGALAGTAREERARQVHDRAQRAAPKIQLVVALLLVPAALLLIAAGMLSGLR